MLTPRVDMEAIDVEDPKEEVAKLFKKTGFSRLPVYEDDIDKIMGVLNQKDFHNYLVCTGKNLSDYVMPVAFVGTAQCVSRHLLRKDAADEDLIWPS